MRTKAAVLHAVNSDLKIEQLDLAEPKASEVLVRMVATSICHSDLQPIHGNIPSTLPMVLGHEGAGIVERVGQAVESVAPGDKVLLTPVIGCSACRPCLTGQPYLCEKGMSRRLGGRLLDGTTRLSSNGNEVYHFFCQSSLSEYAVVPEAIAIRVGSDVSLRELTGLCCGVGTGFGAVVNKAKVEAGSSIAVYGSGGVGLSVLMGAKICGATTRIAVDVQDEKLAIAREIGATHTVNARRENPVQRICEITAGGADYAFECIGSIDTYIQTLESVRQTGTAIVIGMPPFGSKVSIDPMLLIRRTFTGCVMGNMIPAIHLPRWVKMYKDGLLPLAKLASHQYKLEEVNEAIADMHEGKVVKPVIVFDGVG